MLVQVTQYIRPDGRRRTGYIELPDDPERQRKYDELMEEGCNITGEVLRTNEVSTCISHAGLEEDFVEHRTVNPMDGGPSGDEAAGQAIDKWDKDKFLKWKAGVMSAQERDGYEAGPVEETASTPGDGGGRTAGDDF